MEKDLIIRLRRGDEEAFAALFDKYRDKLYSFAFRTTASVETAEDTVQNVFLKLWDFRASLPLMDDLGAYLFRMAKNNLLDGLRRRSRAAVILHEIEKSAALPGSQDDFLKGKEIKAILYNAIDQLTPQQAKVFDLSRIQGFKLEEIAAKLNISIFTVKAHLRDATRVVREYILANYQKGTIYCIILMIPLV